MYAYKLMRERKDGTLGSLFIDRKARYEVGDTMVARSIPTKGFAHRPFIHCMPKPEAPHLSPVGRRWVVVHVVGETMKHLHNGKLWILADKIRIMWKI